MVIQADALVSLRLHTRAAQVAERSFALSPSSDAFLVCFDCAVLGKKPLDKGREALQVTDNRNFVRAQWCT